jgi:hypothetical protein
MTENLDEQIDELYRLPLGDFTKARNKLAKTLATPKKKQVSSLAKPSLPMWLINQLYWQEGAVYNALVDAAEKLRAAHRSVVSGRQADTRAADRLHRTTVEKAFAKAVGIAEKSGVRLTDTVRETIRRTLAALPSDEPAGRLTRAPEPAGFTLLTGIKVLDTKPRLERPKFPVKKADRLTRSEPSREEVQAQKRAEREAERQAERKRKEAERKARKAQLEQEKRQRQIRKAEQALRDAERRLAELKG